MTKWFVMYWVHTAVWWLRRSLYTFSGLDPLCVCLPTVSFFMIFLHVLTKAGSDAATWGRGMKKALTQTYVYHPLSWLELYCWGLSLGGDSEWKSVARIWFGLSVDFVVCKKRHEPGNKSNDVRREQKRTCSLAVCYLPFLYLFSVQFYLNVTALALCLFPASETYAHLYINMPSEGKLLKTTTENIAKNSEWTIPLCDHQWSLLWYASGCQQSVLYLAAADEPNSWTWNYHRKEQCSAEKKKCEFVWRGGQ